MSTITPKDIAIETSELKIPYTPFTGKDSLRLLSMFPSIQKTLTFHTVKTFLILSGRVVHVVSIDTEI